MVASSSKYIRDANSHFVCPHCPKVTEKQNTMYYHIKKIHEKDLPFACKRCDDCPRFLQRTSYLHHLATIHADDPHPEESGVEAGSAGPSLPTKSEGKEVNEGTVEKKAVERNPYAGVSYSCPCCDHKTHTKANVLIHFSRSHCKDWIPNYEKGSACACCNKVFASSSAYLYHATGCYKGRASEDQLNMLSRIR